MIDVVAGPLPFFHTITVLDVGGNTDFVNEFFHHHRKFF